MPGSTYGTRRYKPSGDWVQTSHLENVAGLMFRKPDVIAFAKAVKKAERKDLGYGVRLEPQPNNPHDPRAIAVYGYAEKKGLFGRGTGRWHIGYLPAGLAAEIATELVAKGIPIAAELYSIYEGIDNFFDIKVLVLAPPGHGVKARTRKHPV